LCAVALFDGRKSLRYKLADLLAICLSPSRGKQLAHDRKLCSVNRFEIVAEKRRLGAKNLAQMFLHMESNLDRALPVSPEPLHTRSENSALQSMAANPLFRERRRRKEIRTVSLGRNRAFVGIHTRGYRFNQIKSGASSGQLA
jgi:hypothetical protein